VVTRKLFFRQLFEAIPARWHYLFTSTTFEKVL
jgi:hypothetical protein